MRFFMRTLIALASVGAIMFVFAGSATASDEVTYTVLEQSATANIGNVTVSAESLATGKVVVLSYVWAKGVTKKQQAHSRCRMVGAGTDVPVYTNTGLNSSGQYVRFSDTRRVKTCFVNGNWRKVVCGNILYFKAPKTKLTFRQVIMVKSFARVKIHLHAHAKVSAAACGAYAEAEGTADVWILIRIFVRSKGDTVTKIFSQAIAKAKANAKVHIECTPPPPPPPPTNRPPIVEIENPPAHVCVNGQVEIRANYSDPDGDVLHVSWSTNYGTLSSGTTKVTYTAPGAPGTATVTVTVTDGEFTRSASTSFPVRAGQWPPTPETC